jgi:hypothetical protein
MPKKLSVALRLCRILFPVMSREEEAAEMVKEATVHIREKNSRKTWLGKWAPCDATILDAWLW